MEQYLERKTIPIKMCSAGNHFNSTSMLGFHKVCYCTLTATATCHAVIISRSSYVQAMEQYPGSDQAAKEMAKQEHAAEEAFRDNTRRMCRKGELLNKNQAVMSDAFNR